MANNVGQQIISDDFAGNSISAIVVKDINLTGYNIGNLGTIFYNALKITSDIQKGNAYYVEYNLTKNPDISSEDANLSNNIINNVDICLYYKENGKDNKKIIKNHVSIELDVKHSFIFTPDKDYSSKDDIFIVFEYWDAISSSKNGSSIKFKENEANQIRLLNNKKPDGKIITFGIQGKSGSMFAINGEEFVIGRRGIFELMETNFQIDSICFAPSENSFILDYIYE